MRTPTADRLDEPPPLSRTGHCRRGGDDAAGVQALAEQRLIPAAADHGVAVMVNSGFGNGSYFSGYNRDFARFLIALEELMDASP